MALDLSGFTTPSVDASAGLFKIAEGIKTQKKLNSVAAEKQIADENVLFKTLQGITDPKDYLSGSSFDPKITQGLHDIQTKGTQLIANNKGLSTAMLAAQLGQDISNISKYSSTAKTAKKMLDDGIAKFGKGYDKSALYSQAQKSIFLNPDGTEKKMEEVDLNQNPFELAIQNYPELVTTNEGLDEWLSKEKNNTNIKKIKTRDKGGKIIDKDIEMTSPVWSIPETDKNGIHTGKFVPAYDLAVDAGEQIVHKYTDQRGQEHESEVRLLPEETYNSIINNSPQTVNWVKGQIKLHAKEYQDATGNPFDWNSPHADVLARSILYDELKQRNPGSYKDVRQELQPKVTVKVSTGGTQTEKKTAYTSDKLHSALNEVTPSPEGFIDVTEFVPAYKYGNRALAFKKGLQYNPKTKRFLVTLDDKTKEEQSFDKVYSKIKTSNSDPDMTSFEAFETYKPKSIATKTADAVKGVIKKIKGSSQSFWK